MEHPENDDLYKGLKVNKGVTDVPTVNPYLRKRVQRKQYTPAEYVEGILKGNITILSQAVTLVESAKHEHQQIAQEIIEKCLPYAGKSMRIGITGVPGAGKSTSIDVFGMHLLKQGHKLAVLAIDPSSERSKGSILGDKTRMETLSREKDAFIRPSPSAGSLGGVARKTRETIILCEAAGFDTVFVETVGVGQSETAVHSMVDFFLLIQLAGTGDELQGIKRGIMEMADGVTHCIFSRLPNQAGRPKYSPIPVITTSESKRFGIWWMSTWLSRRKTAISNIRDANKPNTGCTKVSTIHCEIHSTTIRLLVPCSTRQNNRC